MKRSLAIIVTLASGMVLSAFAQTPAAGPAKVAVVAFQVAVAQTNEGQRNFADLQKKYEPRRAQLKTLSDELDTLTKQLQAQADKLSPAEQQSRAAAAEIKKKQLDRDAEDAQNDFQQAMQDVFNGVASKVYDVMSGYAQKEGYTLVLDASQQQTPVLYAIDQVNITKPVIEAYNVKSGVPAPAGEPGAAAAPKQSAPRMAPSTAPKPAGTAAH